MSAHARKPTSLGYPFVPVPEWVFDRFEAGLLTTERRHILEALYRRANRAKLEARKPTPDLRLVSLASATLRGDDRRSLDALGRLLRDMRKDGELDYTTTGKGSRTLYLFWLNPDGPDSGVVPGSAPASVPGSNGAQAETGSRIATDGIDGRSGFDSGGSARSVPGYRSRYRRAN